jgi:hypothetical protein
VGLSAEVCSRLPSFLRSNILAFTLTYSFYTIFYVIKQNKYLKC